MSACLSVTYLGLKLDSPILVGACPMTLNPETVRVLAEAGAGAVVLPSLFEEQVVHQILSRGDPVCPDEATAESMSYGDVEHCYDRRPEDYLQAILELKKTARIPIIANLNGCTKGDWLKIAAEIERAGADALEVVLEPAASSELTSDAMEEQLVVCVHELCGLVQIPVSVKLSPYHTNLPNLAQRLITAGADGLVCFSHEPSWRIHSDRIEATLSWTLTPPSHINATIAGLIRARSGAPALSVAACGGISCSDDVIKAIIAGADVVLVTSQVYREGPDVVAHLVKGLSTYLERQGFETYEQLVKSRPSLTIRRDSYLKCLRRPDSTDDSPPPGSSITGDRWGHLD